MESRFCSSQIAGSRTVGTSLPNHVPIKKSPLYQTEYGVRVGRHVWEVQVCLCPVTLSFSSPHSLTPVMFVRPSGLNQANGCEGGTDTSEKNAGFTRSAALPGQHGCHRRTICHIRSRFDETAGAAKGEKMQASPLWWPHASRISIVFNQHPLHLHSIGSCRLHVTEARNRFRLRNRWQG
jgi:hypothetical protein